MMSFRPERAARRGREGRVVGAFRVLVGAEIACEITPEGNRLLILEDADEGSVSPLTIVGGWTQDLDRRRQR